MFFSQDELASLSSRGQGPDEVDLDEQREDREDTPQASAQVSGEEDRQCSQLLKT